jgi:hypothetical protein
MNRSAILQPNSEFERKEELNRLLNKTISEEEQQVLKECTTQDHESIALIGCIVKEDSLVNLARLIIASKNQSNIELALMAEMRLSGYEQQKLIEQMSEQFLTNTQNISEVEDRVYYTLFDVLS